LELFDEAAALRRRAQLIEATGDNDDLRAGVATSPL
jgi:hypothetical protein